MYSFYGGQKGQDFKITRIFANRAIDMVGDLKARWTSPVNVGDYVFINYGDPSYMNEETSNYNTNLQIDLKDSGKSYTNSLWQKIYVDRNLTVSPDFPQNDNNIYIFLNLEEDNKEKYGESLHEVSDLESEECFGFGYRLIACVTGVTPRIQVFHQTINIEDGDPYVTLDLTNPDTPKIKFYLQRGQRIEEVYKNIIGSQEEPNAYLKTEGTYVDKDGNIKTATLTRPQLTFDLPKAPTFYYGMLFGTGPLNFYHNFGTLSNRTNFLNNSIYKVYKKEVQFINKISDFLLRFLLDDTIKYTLDENNKNEDGTYNNFIIDHMDHFYYEPDKKFFKENDKYNKPLIFIQDNKKVIFNPLSDITDNDLKNKTNEILNFYKDLKNDYGLYLAPYSFYDENGDVKTDNVYMWENSDSVETVKRDLVSSLINRSFPNSLYPLSSIINNLLKQLLDIISEDNDGNVYIKNDIPEIKYIFENYNIADYLVGVLGQAIYLNEHYYDVSQAYKADFYVNEPTGKLYILTTINSIYIEGKYIGAITAPAPLAVTQNISSFYKNENDEWEKSKEQVVSSLTEGMNELIYQEEFIFRLPNDPITKPIVIPVANDKDYVINKPAIQNPDMQTVDIEVPMPIHIFTPNDIEGVRSGLSISSKDNKITWDKTKWDKVVFSRGDLFFNITSIEENNADRGAVYRYSEEPVTIKEQEQLTSIDMTKRWKLIGNIKGVPGIPKPAKFVNIRINPNCSTTDGFVIYYKGQDENTNEFNFELKESPGDIPIVTILLTILNGSVSSAWADKIILEKPTNIMNYPDLTVNSPVKDEIVLINYYETDTGSPASYWGIYTDSIWSIMSLSGGSSSFEQSKPAELKEYHKEKGYSVTYLETKYLDDHLIWNDWDPIYTIEVFTYQSVNPTFTATPTIFYNGKYHYDDTFNVVGGDSITVIAKGHDNEGSIVECKIFLNNEEVVYKNGSGYDIEGTYRFIPTSNVRIRNRPAFTMDNNSGQIITQYDRIYITTY